MSLIALAVHQQVRAQGGDLDGCRRRMFTAQDVQQASSRRSDADRLAQLADEERESRRRQGQVR